MLTLPPLYAILDVDLVAARGRDPAGVCRDWLSAGVALIQLRAKTLPSGAFLELADQCAAMSREAGATFIVNDRADIAAVCGADGVHVGQDDLRPADVRAVIGSKALVGLSTHDEAQAADATGQPVSYLAIGPVFGTETKDTGHAAVGLERVRRAASIAHAAGLPLVAIGGITLARAVSVLEAGADSLAVISDLMPAASDETVVVRASRWLARTTAG